MLPPPNLYAKIFAVKRDQNGDIIQNVQVTTGNPDVDNPNTPQIIQESMPVLFDVGLKGNEEKQLVNSYAIFSGLKFKTTSYNHEGAPFYLVISIY